MNPMVSVIIPVYKVEEYLDSCLKSVCSQTYTNLEIILVDDGSPDGCPKKCDEWAKIDSRISVIHQKNRGLSGARNSGLMNCCGDYVLYIDSDDTIAIDMIEHLVNTIEETKSDIAISTFRFSQEKNENTQRLNKDTFCGTSEEMLRIIAECGLWQAWGKLIKRDLALKTPFCEKMVYEDYENTPRLFVNAQKVAISMDGRYYYTVRGDSIMGERQKATNLDFAKITNNNLLLYEKSDFSEEGKKYLHRFLFKQLIFNYNTTIKYGNNRNTDFLVMTREIMKNHKKKWMYDDRISKGKKCAYFFISQFSAIYDLIYKGMHRK